MIAALLVAAATLGAPPPPVYRVAVVFVRDFGWQAPGAAVGGLVTGTECPLDVALSLSAGGPASIPGCDASRDLSEAGGDVGRLADGIYAAHACISTFDLLGSVAATPGEIAPPKGPPHSVPINYCRYTFADLTALPSFDAALSRAREFQAERLVVLSVPRGGHLGGIAVYPGNGVLRGTTRRDGLVTIGDVTAYVLGERDLATAPGGPADVARLDRQVRLQRTYHGFWATGLIALPMLLYIWLVFGRRRAGPVERRIALVLAAYPVAGFLSSLVPWWRASVPWLAATAAVAAATALGCLAGVAAARALDAPSEVGVATVTAAVLTADLLTGGPLQQTGVASYSALAGGRFYGLGNVGFAVLATAAVVALDAASRRYGPRVWLALVPLVGVVAWLGADFGGAVTLTAVLVVALATRARRTAVVLGTLGGLAVATGVAALDYARETPTHLGRFVGEVLHGGWTDTVSRKAGAAAHTVLTWYPLLVVGSAVMAYALLRRCPQRIRPYVVLLVLGSLVNDSGLVVAAAGLAVAVPLLLSYAEQP